jgi:hypothetical protein
MASLQSGKSNLAIELIHWLKRSLRHPAMTFSCEIIVNLLQNKWLAFDGKFFKFVGTVKLKE